MTKHYFKSMCEGDNMTACKILAVWLVVIILIMVGACSVFVIISLCLSPILSDQSEVCESDAYLTMLPVGSLFFFVLLIIFGIWFTYKSKDELKKKNIIGKPIETIMGNSNILFHNHKNSWVTSEFVLHLLLKEEEEMKNVHDLVKHTWMYDKRVGRDSIGLTHSSLEVKQIFRVYNPKLLQSYCNSINSNTFTLPNELHNLPIITSPNNVAENEAYLFHGTKRENVMAIVRNGFDINLAKTGAYGKAIYLAESSEKADQYSDGRNLRETKSLIMLVVRVNLGNVQVYKGNRVNPNTSDVTVKIEEIPDTVVAGLQNRFREFLVTETKRCYPEYVVVYDRIK